MRLLWIALLCGLLIPLQTLYAQQDPLSDDGIAAAPVMTDPALQNWHLLVDQSGQLSLKEVQAERNLFKRLNRPSYASMGSHRAVWLHVQLPAYGEPHWLWVSARHVEFLDVYLLQDGQLLQQIQSGERRPQSLSTPRVSPYLFALPADGQSREAYLRLQSNHPMMAYFQLVGEEALADLEQTAYFHGALLGVLGLLIVYNALYFLFARWAIYAWLCLLHLSLLGCLAANLGLIAAWLPPLASRQSLIADLMPLFSCMALLAFTLNFFRTQGIGWFFWLVRIGFYLLALEALVMPLTAWPWHGLLAHAMALMAGLGALFIAFRCWLQEYLPARLVVLGLLILSLCLMCFLALPAGYQMLESEGLMGSLFWIAAFGGGLLNLALVDQQRQNRSMHPKHSTAADSFSEHPVHEVLLKQLACEIRDPLGSLLDMTRLLADTGLSVKQRDYLRAIEGAGDELLNHTNLMLDCADLVSGHLCLEQHAVRLPELIHDCLESLQPHAERKGFVLNLSIQPELPPLIRGNPARVYQLVMSLLGHILRNAAPGVIVIQVELVQELEESRLYLRVQDQGPLLDSGFTYLLSNPSKVLSHQWVDLLSVWGSGLFVAAAMARSMEGRFGVHPHPPSGNVIWSSWPIDTSHSVERPCLIKGEALRGARLLIVDPDEITRTALFKQCNDWGTEVDAVSDGREALALLRTRAYLHDLFDAVLLAQHMPGMTGLQLATKIKGDPALCHDVSLILLTEGTDPVSHIEARNAGLNGWLTKPISRCILKNLLISELGRRPHWHALLQAEQEQPIQIPNSFRVLIAEDDRASIQVICSMLAKVGLVPDVVGNGQAALDAIKKHRYDLVLMDCEMPVLDGYEATRLLRVWEQQNPALPHTVVVALTAHVLTEHQERARQAGMDEYIPKPVELSRLRELLRKRVCAKNRMALLEKQTNPLEDSAQNTG